MADKQIVAEENFIRDGVTQRGYIAANPGLWGEEDFTFRPMLGQVAEEADQKTTKMLERNEYQQAYVMRCQYVLKHLIGWKRDEPLTMESILRVRRQVLLRMFEIIAGNGRSDIPPDHKPALPEPGADETLGKFVIATDSSSPGT